MSEHGPETPMSADLVERAARRMARRNCEGALEPHLSRLVEGMWPTLAEDAREAVLETLEAMQAAAMHRIGWLAIRDAIAVFARENGLQMPLGAPTEAQEGPCRDGTENPLSGPNSFTKSISADFREVSHLPAYRTPGGHAA